MDRTTQSYFEDLQAEVRTYNNEGFNQIMACFSGKGGLGI
jgi:hypothetical protein